MVWEFRSWKPNQELCLKWSKWNLFSLIYFRKEEMDSLLEILGLSGLEIIRVSERNKRKHFGKIRVWFKKRITQLHRDFMAYTGFHYARFFKMTGFIDLNKEEIEKNTSENICQAIYFILRRFWSHKLEIYTSKKMGKSIK